MTFDLPDALRNGLETIADQEPHSTDEELVAVVLSRGILAMLTEAHGASISSQEIADNLAAVKERLRSLQLTQGPDSELPTKSAVRVWPRPSVTFKREREQRERELEAERDVGLAEAPEPTDGREEERTIAPHRDVENYVACPLTPKMQRDLETFLEGHPEADIEVACMTLLQLGIRQVEIDLRDIRRAKAERDGSGSEKADKTVRLAEKLYMRAKRRCGA
jgi:hypothetical protein